MPSGETHLLDTNAVIGLLKGLPQLTACLRRHDLAHIAISSVVAHELYYGAFRSQSRLESLRRVDALRFTLLPFDAADARRSGEVRAALADAGTPIGPYDVLIAGQALARNLTLVSRNLREFRRVPGLAVEDWESPSAAS